MSCNYKYLSSVILGWSYDYFNCSRDAFIDPGMACYLSGMTLVSPWSTSIVSSIRLDLEVSNSDPFKGSSILPCATLHSLHSLHYTALQFTALHCTAFHCSTLNCPAQHCHALHGTGLFVSDLVIGTNFSPDTLNNSTTQQRPVMYGLCFTVTVYPLH